jgi:O-acetyl-ADP-ribose deacetylase (regulator of RNase III)
MEKTVKQSVLRCVKGDITQMEVEAFVFYARPDLKLGTGFGNAIAMRGGPGIQQELDQLGRAETGEVVVTGAGRMKAKNILHAVGPRFQEPRLEEKLQTTIQNALRVADQKGIRQIAFPPMGAGFWGVPLDASVAITVDTIQEYLQNETQIREVVLCANDNREYRAFQAYLEKLS